MYNLLQFRKNLDRTDHTIIGASSLLLLCVLALLFNEEAILEFLDLEKNDESPIAEIITSANDIRRKGDQSVIWGQVKSKGKLFRDDTIYSGDSSKLEFRLTADKTNISLGPQTLIKLTRDSHQNNSLAVLHGRVSIKLGKSKNLTLSVGGKTYEITSKDHSADTAIQVSAAGASHEEPRIEVVSGQVDLKDMGSPEKTTTVTSQSPFEVSQSAKLEINRLPASSVVETIPIVAEIPMKAKIYSEQDEDVDEEEEPAEDEVENLPETKDYRVVPDVTLPDTLRFTTILGASSYQGTTNAGGKVSRPSKLDYGLQATWLHQFAAQWSFGLSFGFQRTDLESYSDQSSTGMPSTQYQFGLETSKKITQRLALDLVTKYKQKAFITAVSKRTIQFEKTWLPEVFLKLAYDFYKSENFLFGGGPQGGIELPPLSGNIDPTLGNSFGGSIYMERELSKILRLRGEATLLNRSQNILNIQQSRTEQTLQFSLLYAF